MEHFLFASASDQPAEVLLGSCLEQLGPVPNEANLGFVYASDGLAENLDKLVQDLGQKLPGVQWVGALGIALCVTGEELYERPALALLVGDFPPDSFRLLPTVKNNLREADDQLKAWWHEQQYLFALLHGDPGNPSTPELVQMLATGTGNTFCNGGISSSQGQNLQVCDGVTSGGVCGVLFNQDVPVLTDHTQGCSPIGPPHSLTKAQRNIAFTLDQRPALEVMKEEIGEILARDLKRIGGLIFAALPIQGSDTGDYLVRNLVGIDPEHGLVAVGDYLEGQERLMFCRRDGNTAREDLERMLERLRQRVGGRRIRGGVYISCLGRGRYQFGDDSQELRTIRDRLGDFPLVGFFANGEIYNGRLYGYTGVLTLFL